MILTYRQLSASVLTGMILGLILSLPVAHADPLYDRIRKQVERELLRSGETTVTDPLVDEFLVETYEPMEGAIERKNIPNALIDAQTFCDDQQIKKFGRCPEVRRVVQRIAGSEMQPRHLGLNLNILAQSYEQALLGTDILQGFPARAQAVVRIWQPGLPSAGTGAFKTRLRAMAVPESDAMRDAFGELRTSLNKLPGPADGTNPGDNGSIIGAGWRYRFGGVRFLRGERTAYFPAPLEDDEADNTERQYMFARWTEVEDKLIAIEDLLPPDSEIDPPLGTGDILLYQFPQTYQTGMPENLQVWAYREFQAVDQTIDGDVGLTFDHALEPVLPALCADETEITTGRTECEPIRGGFYPPPPPDVPDPALCTHPYMRQGYMCRPLDEQTTTECVEELDPSDSEIILTRCTATGSTRATMSGPDACLDTTWYKEKPFDPEKQCKVKIVCDDSSPFSGGVTEPKKADGTINIKMKLQPDGPAPYIILHELVHARQACDKPVGHLIYLPPVAEGDTEEVRLMKNRGCCQMEGEAYRLQAEMMEADGIFREGDEFNGLPINRETFWQVTLDFSCRQRGYGSCPNTFTYEEGPAEDMKNPPAWMVQFIQYVVNTLAPPRIPEWMSMSCTDTMTPPPPDLLSNDVQKMRDPRIDGFVRELSEVGREACAPNAMTEYENTIGNNACFFDRCLERSLEAHNIVGGRQAFTTYDQAYPQDPSLTEQPKFASLLALPSFQPFSFNDYRPAFIVNLFDRIFCDGSTPQGVPVLCIARRPRSDAAIGRTPDTLVQTQLDEEDQRTREIRLSQELSEAVGFRMGNRLYAKYLGFRTRQLSTIIEAAARYLTAFTRVEFPEEMCPMGPYSVSETPTP